MHDAVEPIGCWFRPNSYTRKISSEEVPYETRLTNRVLAEEENHWFGLKVRWGEGWGVEMAIFGG
eukprot:CAMPEP_0203733882 /NCGR_PEP_ID=MMETSP0092-20131115/28357_1 /ASSEMBLY_ACC=CAM_ASM_001090 /TAXON_ID=426623 /ORGANISM="Chaetoceros affinis, Strain CCMP159" /LENGTH=64 /DNA_ID=CAMNT_0050617893 /DNA_START=890 /DNA_END=1084 /DNA_ORIENTATION=-